MLEKLTSIFRQFSGNTIEENGSWIILDDKNSVDQLVDFSYHRPQLVFKHSPRCSVSSMVSGEMNQLEAHVSEQELQVDLYWVDVVNNRLISQYLSEQSDIRHESPQVLLWSNGEVLWHESHSKIKADKVLREL